MKEVMMTRRVRLWITAVLSIAAMALMVGLTIATQGGVEPDSHQSARGWTGTLSGDVYVHPPLYRAGQPFPMTS
jgi:hypothetical protein